MTEVLERPDTVPAPPVEEDVNHIVCGVSSEEERTVPMYALCGFDITFDKLMMDRNDDIPLCKECEELWPKHLIKCEPGSKCNLGP